MLNTSYAILQKIQNLISSSQTNKHQPRTSLEQALNKQNLRIEIDIQLKQRERIFLGEPLSVVDFLSPVIVRFSLRNSLGAVWVLEHRLLSDLEWLTYDQWEGNAFELIKSKIHV
jgi:hypothetical protein